MTELYASVDLGGTNVHAALAGADGRIVAEEKMPTASHEGPERVLARIAALVNALAERTGAQPRALGVGVPGLVDVERGVTKFLPNLPTNWRDIGVRAALEPAIGCPVFILNDARTATLGEMIFGHGRNARTLLYFGLGTGVGGGVVIDGKLRLGPLGAAGEIGHQTVLPDGPLCGCGNRGCLETLASAPALMAEGVRLLRSGQSPQLHALTGGIADRVTPETMAAAARSGDEAVALAFARAGEWLGIGVANMVTALHPEIVVIGGGVALAGDLLLPALTATLRERVRMFPVDTVRVAISELGDRAGLLGGIALASRGSEFLPKCS
ncbi:MAG TPA: ROK family protein [Chthoniobacteraceae bacterium]|jgi:glucokinase|nr:ROK family protein [Chthoniobacteraceae bacterium]